MKRYVPAMAHCASLCAAALICTAAAANAQSVSSPWIAADIGAPVLSGSASQSAAGVFTLTGGGTDIAGKSDQFMFVYQQVAGDLDMVARVDDLDGAGDYAKAGLMIRKSLAANAANVLDHVTVGAGVRLSRRLSDGGMTKVKSGAALAAPVWLRVTRKGSQVTSYWSSNGTTWTTINADTISFGTSVYVGLAVNGRSSSSRATAVISNVKLASGAASGTLPPGQQNTDIGSPAIAGNATYSSGAYTVKAAGADIWGTADQFQFVYQPVTGDTQITARAVSLTNTNAWAKAGVMIRESLTAGSRHAMSAVSAGSGYAFQRRLDTDGVSTHTSGGSGAAPGWLRLSRTGDLFQAFRSSDGVAWTLIGSETIAMTSTVYVGLAVTSHNASAAATAVFDGVAIAAQAGNQSPAVTLTQPANNTQVTAPATVTLAATASDPENRMAKVEFYVEGTMVGSDTTAPYSASWSASTPGTYALRATAYDADGGSSTSTPVTLVVAAASNGAPTVSLTSPANGAAFTAPATISLAANAADPENQLSRVEFYNGATLLGTDTTSPYAFSWTNVPAGTYTLSAAAYDAAGNKGTSAAVTVTVAVKPNAPPAVSLTSPASGATFTAPAAITLTATASDPEGQLARVEFYSGTTRLASVTAAPYTFTWSNVAAGTYSLTAVAVDGAAATATSAVAKVTVSSPTSSAPTAVAFTASADHSTNVTSYLLSIYAQGANPATAAPVATSDLGKPAPAANNDITVDRAAFFSGLAPGTYLATVTAIGPGGRTPSASVTFAR